MSTQSNVSAPEHVVPNEQLTQVTGGAANDFWHWRKSVEESPNHEAIWPGTSLT